jgi:hypothetical protein
MKTNNYLISLSELDDYLAKKIPLIIQKYLDDFEANRSSTLNQDDLLTRHEAATEFKVSIATIDNYRRDGQLTPYRAGEKMVRYKRSELNKLFKPTYCSKYKTA